MNMAEFNTAQGQDLINITQGSAQGANANSALNRQQPSGKKHNFNELLILLSNTDNTDKLMDKRCKQSLFKGIIQQLDHQELLCKTQSDCYREVKNMMQSIHGNMNRLREMIASRLSSMNHDSSLQQYYDEYDKTFIEQNKLQN